MLAPHVGPLPQLWQAFIMIKQEPFYKNNRSDRGQFPDNIHETVVNTE